jgi:uncharacterized protein YndB with AHSA1/START domain
MTTFTTSRTFPVTPETLFAAMQDPDRLARWWGPTGFSNRFDVCEFRTGGRWLFTMVGPDGTCYPNEACFTLVDPGREVVIAHTNAPQFQLRITLSPEADGTLLNWVQTFADPAVAQAVRHIVEPANEQNLDRLAAELRQVGASPS